jgi:hypothetical protein
MDWIASALIALVALGFSVFTFYKQQGRAERLARGNVKPILFIDRQRYPHLKSIILMNRGVGPAIIVAAQFTRNSRSTKKLVELFDRDIWERFRVDLPVGYAIPPLGDVILAKASIEHLVKEKGYSETEAIDRLRQWQMEQNEVVVHIEYEDILGTRMVPLIHRFSDYE